MTVMQYDHIKTIDDLRTHLALQNALRHVREYDGPAAVAKIFTDADRADPERAGYWSEVDKARAMTAECKRMVKELDEAGGRK